jgi:hypothetical protein
VVVRRHTNGVGVVYVNGFGVWALWVCESECGNRRVRLSIDDFEALGIHEYQRVRLKLPRQPAEDVYCRGRRENPPFVWLDLGKDVRR